MFNHFISYPHFLLMMHLKGLVNHTFFYYMKKFSWLIILFGACQNEANHCETTCTKDY